MNAPASSAFIPCSVSALIVNNHPTCTDDPVRDMAHDASAILSRRAGVGDANNGDACFTNSDSRIWLGTGDAVEDDAPPDAHAVSSNPAHATPRILTSHRVRVVRR